MKTYIIIGYFYESFEFHIQKFKLKKKMQQTENLQFTNSLSLAFEGEITSS